MNYAGALRKNDRVYTATELKPIATELLRLAPKVMALCVTSQL
jgi:hypothetical protein